MILRRSINCYYLMKDDNQQVPRSFKSNKVPGILFENKADYTTFFSVSEIKAELKAFLTFCFIFEIKTSQNQVDAIHMIQVSLRLGFSPDWNMAMN